MLNLTHNKLNHSLIGKFAVDFGLIDLIELSILIALNLINK